MTECIVLARMMRLGCREVYYQVVEMWQMRELARLYKADTADR